MIFLMTLLTGQPQVSIGTMVNAVVTLLALVVVVVLLTLLAVQGTFKASCQEVARLARKIVHGYHTATRSRTQPPLMDSNFFHSLLRSFEQIEVEMCIEILTSLVTMEQKTDDPVRDLENFKVAGKHLCTLEAELLRLIDECESRLKQKSRLLTVDQYTQICDVQEEFRVDLYELTQRMETYGLSREETPKREE